MRTATPKRLSALVTYAHRNQPGATLVVLGCGNSGDSNSANDGDYNGKHMPTLGHFWVIHAPLLSRFVLR
jgi:hypothetical protein